MTGMRVRHQHSWFRIEKNERCSRRHLQLLLLAQSLFASRVHVCNGLVDGLHRGSNLRGFAMWKSLQRTPLCRINEFYNVLTLPSSATRPRTSRKAKLSSSDHDEECGDGIWRNQTSDNRGRDEPAWQVGDVFQDLYRLEAEMNFSSSEENLGRAERIEVLQHFAKQRRRVYPDVRSFILWAPVGALGLSCLLKCPATRPLASLVTIALDWHFWLAVVAAPIFLLAAKRLTMPPPAAMPDELKELIDIPYGVLEDWEDQESSCRDHVLFLLEYWTSSVVGMASVGCITRMTSPFPTNYKPVLLWLAFAQLLTRMGALASLHQYSNQLFQLERKHQPRPLSLFGSLLQPLVRNVHKCGLLGIASDFSKILVHLERDSLLALYATITILLAMFSHRLHSSTIRDISTKQGDSLVTKFAYALVGAAAVWNIPLSNLRHIFRIVPFKSLVYQFEQGPLIVGLTHVATILLVLTPIVSPVVHLLAITRIFRVHYTHDLSLDMNAAAFEAGLADDTKRPPRMAWRYRIEWREPKRFGQLMKQWNQDLEYWWLVKGTVTEKFGLESQQFIRRQAMDGISILNRIERDLANDTGRFTCDRDQWKVHAMDRMAAKHKFDYDRKNYDDPLGVAVERTLGIGLGFNFKHMKPLTCQDTPSVRRLQARTAKSAVHHVQHLYNASASELDGIGNYKKRGRRQKELKVEIDKEVQYLAQKLTELVPTTDSEEFEADEGFQIYLLRDYVKTGDNQYTLKHHLPQNGSSTVTKLFKDIQMPNPTFEITDFGIELGDSEEQDENMSNRRNGEFIEAYLDQKNIVGSDNDEGNTVLA